MDARLFELQYSMNPHFFMETLANPNGISSQDSLLVQKESYERDFLLEYHNLEWFKPVFHKIWVTFFLKTMKINFTILPL